MVEKVEMDPRSEAGTAHRLALVVLTWNGRENTLACLESLEGQLRSGDAVVVVDNGSGDGTYRAVADRFPWAVYLENRRNLGFAGGNNVGLRWCLENDFPWIMLLNNDTVVPPGALDGLVEYLANHTEVGVVQPLLVNAGNPGLIDSSGQEIFHYPGARDRQMGHPVSEAPSGPVAVFGACAAAALFRRECLREVGLLDEDFFVLLEDVDLMFRLRAAGWEIHLLPEVRVAHKRGVSVQEDKSRMSLAKRFWLHRNILAIACRYWPPGQLLLFSPFLAKASLWAIWAGRRSGGGRCVPLWWKSLKIRRRSRRAIRLKKVMSWQLPRPFWDIYLQWFRRRFLGLPERPWPGESFRPPSG